MKEDTQNRIWELASKNIHDELNESEKKELEKLLRKTVNEEFANKTKKIHENLKYVHLLKEISKENSWKTISDYFKKKTIRLYWSAAKYAAIILIAVLAGTVLSNYWNPLLKSPLTYTEVKVPLGQMSEIKLSDGTNIWLNSGTTLEYPSNFGKDNRSVKINGEAFLKVKKSEIPFKVELKQTVVEVLGTSFNVISYGEDDFSNVTLLEGLVEINDLAGERIALLNPEEQIHIPSNTKNYTINNVNIDFYQSWTEGKIVFDDERLIEVARRLERWYNVDIQFDTLETGELRFTGTILKNKPFDQIVKAFSLLLPVSIEYQNNLGNKDVIKISKK